MENRTEGLRVSGAPHVRAVRNTASIMGDVIIGLLPALAFAVWMFGSSALLLTLVCVVSCTFFEWLFRRATGRSYSLDDRSAIITGLILAFTLPASLPLWMAAVGSFVAIVIVKQLFGGLGGNFANPAATASIALSVSFSVKMNTWPITPAMAPAIFDTGIQDAVSGPTPLLLLKQGMGDLPSHVDLFFGRVSGGLGEICVLALLAGGIWLIARRVISPLVPLCFLGSMAAVSLIFARDPLYDIMAGGAVLAAFFMATDPVTSPMTDSGKVIFGLGCGVLTMFIRIYSVFSDGTLFALLLMNIVTPHIDRLIRVRVPRPWRREGEA